MAPDFKPLARVVDPAVQPFDMSPILWGRCPLCQRLRARLTRHHVVPKGQGGDDVPENLVWCCGDGTTGCHGVLTHRNRDGATGFTYPQVAGWLLSYLACLPAVCAYVAGAKWDGWLDHYYRGRDAA